MRANWMTVVAVCLLGCSPGLMEESPDDTDGNPVKTQPVFGSGGATWLSSAPLQGGAGDDGATTLIEPAPGCFDTATTLKQTIVARYAGEDITVDGDVKTYHLTTNWWGLYEDQSVTLNGLGFTVNNPSNVSVAESVGSPIGYPSLFIGSYDGTTTVGSNLPKQVATLSSVLTVFDTNALTLDTSNFNAAYDVWFTSGTAPLPKGQYDPGTGGAYLMVWLFDPASRQPRGINAHPGQVIPGVDGIWDVWIDTTDPPCITYVRTKPANLLTFDLNALIQDSVNNQYGITGSMYLSLVFAGFEIWGNGDGLTLNRFCAEVR